MGQTRPKVSSKKRLERPKFSYQVNEEIINNAKLVNSLKPWERKYLKVQPWSYVHEGRSSAVKGYVNLLEPLKCEETLVRIDRTDVKVVLKIMGRDWSKSFVKSGKRKKTCTTGSNKRGTKGFDVLVDRIGKEEDELVSWWKRPYCSEYVRKYVVTSEFISKIPMFFKSYDEEERLWAFFKRMNVAAAESVRTRYTRTTDSSSEGASVMTKSKLFVSRKKSNKRRKINAHLRKARIA